jgi:hypothetical protein
MAIRALSRQEFARFGATRLTLNGRSRTVVEWFADETGVFIGTIACQESDLDWSFMILQRNLYGRFHIFHLESGCLDVDRARRLLFDRMEAALALLAESAAPTT